MKKMSAERINKIYDFAIGKIPLEKAQVAVRLKYIAKDELKICQFIAFIYNRQLLYRFSDKVIEKLINHIETPKYAKWILRFNLPYNRTKLVGLVSKDAILSADALCDQLPLTLAESNKLFAAIVKNPQAIIRVLSSIYKLDDSKKEIILKNYNSIKSLLSLFNVQVINNTYMKEEDKDKYLMVINKCINIVSQIKEENQ